MDRVELLSFKKRLLCDMLASTQRMCDLIGKDQFEQLGEEAEKRQQIIDQINQIDTVLVDASDNDLSSGLVHDITADIEMLLGEIHQINQSNNSVMAEKQKEFSSQIKNIKQTKKGINGYAAPFNMQGSVFIDAKK